MIEQGVQYLFVGLVLIGGGMAALSRHVLYNIIGLGISLFGLAGLFLQLLKKAALLRPPWTLQNRGLQYWSCRFEPIEGGKSFRSPFQIMLKDTLIDLRAVV